MPTAIPLEDVKIYSAELASIHHLSESLSELTFT